jgi:hypothetical protein
MLSLDYNVTDDDCKGGSPRLQVALDDADADTASDGNVFIYLGPTPNFTGCTPNATTSSGNLAASSTDLRYDLTQFGGAFYSSYNDMINLLGSSTIVSISAVADAGWAFADGEQTVLIDNVNINGDTYDFTPLPPPPATSTPSTKDAFNPAFKNQGQCVSSVVNQSPNR